MRAARAPRSEQSDVQVLERGQLAPLVIYLERVIEEYPYFRNLLDRFLPETVGLIFFQERNIYYENLR